MGKSSLATGWYPAYEGNFTYGRSGRRIEAITIHHMAGVLSSAQCGNIFATPGRCGSSNYGIGVNGDISCYVDEDNTSWANSNWDSNCKSVTIETSNCATGGEWPVSDAALNSLIKLVADIAKRNNLGVLVKGQNLTWHSMFASTQCPGPYLLSKLDYIIDEANKINSVAKITYEQIEKKSVILNKDCNLWNFNYSNWNEAQSIKSFNAGTQIDNIVAIATNGLGARYYVTEYSYNTGVTNGFNVVDCNDIIAEEPKEEPKEEPVVIEPVKEPEKEEKEEKQEEPKTEESALIKFIKWLITTIINCFRKD